jgi:hypothetical protein
MLIARRATLRGFNDMSIRRTILSSIVGGAAGAFSGAALLSIPTYLSKEIGFFGPDRDLAPLVASIGFVVGIIPGTVIGFVVGLLRTRLLDGAIVGMVVGFLILPILIAMGADPHLDRELFSFAVCAIPIGGVIGLFVAAINRRRPATPPNNSTDRSSGRVFPNLTD